MADPFAFLSADGAMIALMRRHDWAATPLGPSEDWPAALKTLLGVMIGSPQPMLLVWGAAQTTLYNEGYAVMLGGRHPGAIGQPFGEVWFDIWDQVEPILARAYAGEPTYMSDIQFEMRRHGYPEETHFDFSYTPVRDESGGVIGMFCVCTETTERVAAEKALRESEAAMRGREAQFRLLAQSVPNQVWTATVDGTLDWFNDRTITYYGATIDQLTADWVGFVHPEDAGFAGKAWADAVTGRTLYEAEFRVRRADGAYRWNLSRAEAVTDENGVVRWIGTNADIHDHKATLNELTAINQALEQAVEERTRERDGIWTLIPDLLMTGTLDGQLLSINPAWTRLLGYDEATLLATPFWQFIHPDDLPVSAVAVAEMRRGESARHENRVRAADGSYRWFDWVSTPKGNNFHAVARDVTVVRERQAELEQAQEQLRQAQKMEAVGQLTGGIAHDFNNMLAVVIGSLDLLSRRIDAEDARSRRYVDNAMEGGRRAAALTQRLLAFSRQQPLSPEAIDTNRLVSGMSDLLRHTLSGAIHLEAVLGGGLWRCHVDPNQLENAILNLAVNARDAMPDGGRLTIETQNAHLDDRYAAAHLGLAPGQYVLVAVSDTGSGMPAEVIEKAFDPFFTTKEIGKGTGLGLSQVYGFVKQSGGHVKIYSEPGEGTVVKLYLPRHHADAAFDAPAAAVKASKHAAAGGEERELVLVVEDDAGVRQVTLDALHELGYRSLEADGAGEALRLLELNPDIVLLFTDIVMPDVNGRKLADEAQRRKPGLKVLFTTGYTRNAIVHNGVLDPGVQLIGKPYTLDDLALKLRSVIDAA